MRYARRISLAVTVMVIAVLVGAVSALAAAPPNDNRAQAQVVRLGSTVTGTTADATVEAVEPASGCGSPGPSVWYRLDPSASGRAIAFLQARGDLDVVVDVYRRERSQTELITCDLSDRHGQSSADFRVHAGESYLIRVAQRPESSSGTFALTVGFAKPAERPPGRRLPAGGASGTVRRVFEPSNAWSARLRAGRTYRVNLAAEGCLGLAIYLPGTSSFDEAPMRTVGCNGYAVFTPRAGESGRYSFVVTPGRSREVQRYHLQVGGAGADDTSPGRFIGNHDVVHSRLNAKRLDVVDLYRFDVVHRSITQLRVRSGTDVTVTLLSQWGRRLARGTDVSVTTRPGRYFAAVRAGRLAGGRYNLRRASRTITRTRLSANPTTAAPGRSVSLTTLVQPVVNGPVTVVVERFDPLAGYQFLRQFRTRAVGGVATVTLAPRSVGHYRARAAFEGTRDAASSGTAWRHFAVEAPLTE